MTANTTASATASYSRYMYGLGVFHARTKVSLTVSELAKSLALSPTQAEAMMSEMVASNVVRTTTQTGLVQAVSQHMKPSLKPSLSEWHDRFIKLSDSPDDTSLQEVDPKITSEFDEDGLAGA